MKCRVGLFTLLVALAFAVAATAEPRITVSAGAGAMSGSMNVAADKGFFKEEGVNAQVVSYKKGKTAFDKFLAGEDDLATCNMVGIVLTDFDLSKSRIIATVCYSDSEIKVLGRKSAGIAGIPDLRGKRIGTAMAGSSHFFLCKLLILNGIATDEAEIVFMKKNELANAIAKGEVDAICVHGMPLEKAKKKIEGDWVEFQDDSIYRIGVQLLASKKMLDEQPELIKGLLKGTLKGEAFIAEHTEEAVEILAKDKGYPLDVMDRTVRDEMEFDLSLKQSLLIQIELIEKWAIENKLVDRTVPRDYLEFIDWGPLESVAPEKVTIIR